MMVSLPEQEQQEQQQQQLLPPPPEQQLSKGPVYYTLTDPVDRCLCRHSGAPNQ
jgi:hypothetical protein